MTENELKKYWGKTVRIQTKTGDIIVGFVGYFSSSLDNEPDEASLIIETPNLVEVYISQIKNIEIIRKS